MAEVKKNPNRKFGWGSLFMLLIIGLIIFGVVRSILGTGGGNAPLAPEEFLNKIGTIEQVEVTEKDPVTGEEKVVDIYFKYTLKDSIPFKEISSKSCTGENYNYYEISGKYKDGKGAGNTTFTTRLYESQYETLIKFASEASKLEKTDDRFFKFNTPTLNSSFNLWSLLSILIPVALGIFVIIFIIRSGNRSNNQAFDFGKNRARLTRKGGTTFKDVAGLDEEKEEMVEIVDFLKNPKKYFDMGARIPKGVLLVGSPGTGKTLLARAVAGEANVPFYTISGSDFVEMFVGVGASRVRDMFKEAKRNAPCIIFIDEIDAVGRQRGTGLGGGHDEREQTLNQLLVEMDGFGTNSGIIVMAATNRADILDPALLRPGRFDRQIHISLPDVKAREEILKVHARNKHLSPRVNLLDVARRTPGFSGADLENLLNEAALLAARENCREIKIYHLDEAVDRVMMGPAKKSKKYTETEKALVAYHEAGHAVIGIRLKHASVVQKITIVPRGDAGGYNLMTPAEETFLQTKQTLTAQITSLLAGRIAEQLVFNQMTTGAHNDFQKATAIARAMVTEYGMSSLGPIQYERNSAQVFLGRDYMSDKNFSDQVALEIDNEVRKIIEECYKQGEELLKENRQLLDTLAKHLVEIETLTKEDIDELVNTGKLNWWEKKKAKMAEALATEEVKPTEVKEETKPVEEKKDEENK